MTIVSEGQTFTLSGYYGSGYSYLITDPVGLGYHDITWRADVTNARPVHPRLNEVRARCKAAVQPTTAHAAIPVNDRRDGLLIASSDVIYTSVTQPANTRLIVTLDAVAASGAYPDFDLFASTSTAYPDYSNFTWKSDHINSVGGVAGAGEALDLGVTGSSPRAVYLGVRSYAGAGHFTLRANVARSNTGDKSLKVCLPGIANIESQPGWLGMRKTLQLTMLRLLQMTHGNIQRRLVVMKTAAAPGNPLDEFCASDSTCEWCSGHTSNPDPCGFAGVPGASPGRVRIPAIWCANYGNPDFLAYILAHEAGHGVLGMGQPQPPFMDSDEYTANGPICGHSIMNWPDTAYRLCTSLNHCYDPRPGAGAKASYSCAASNSNWNNLQTYQSAAFYSYPNLWKSAQPWRAIYTNVWAGEVINFSFM